MNLREIFRDAVREFFLPVIWVFNKLRGKK